MMRMSCRSGNWRSPAWAKVLAGQGMGILDTRKSLILGRFPVDQEVEIWIQGSSKQVVRGTVHFRVIQYLSAMLLPVEMTCMPSHVSVKPSPSRKVQGDTYDNKPLLSTLPPSIRCRGNSTGVNIPCMPNVYKKVPFLFAQFQGLGHHPHESCLQKESTGCVSTVVTMYQLSFLQKPDLFVKWVCFASTPNQL